MWIALILSGQVVIGNSSLSTDLILKTFEQGYEQVLNLYKAHGFLRTTIKVKNDTILIDEGPQFKVGYVTICGNQVFNEKELLSVFQTNIFNESEFVADIDRIIKKYENCGYPYCTVKIDSISLNADNVDVWLQIIEGPLIRISDIKIEGNRITKDYVILRELTIKQGDIFREYKIRESVQRVNRLEFIELVESNLVNRDEFYIHIKEKPSSFINGAFGYGKPGFMGAIELEVLNLMGTGRVGSGRWQKTDTTSTFFDFKYKEPWVLGYPIHLVGYFFQRAYLSYVKNRAELLLDIPATTTLTVSAGMSWTWVRYNDNITTRYREMLGIEFNSTHNLSANSRVHYRAKSEWDVYKLEESMLNLDNWISSPIPTIVLFLSANFGAILRKEVELYDKIKVGGARTLRGYWEEEFSASKVGWLNIEGQKSITSYAFIFPFYDIGYIDGEIKQSFGFGIAAKSPIGVIKIVYGLPKGAAFIDGKLHISIKTTF